MCYRRRQSPRRPHREPSDGVRLGLEYFTSDAEYRSIIDLSHLGNLLTSLSKVAGDKKYTDSGRIAASSGLCAGYEFMKRSAAPGSLLDMYDVAFIADKHGEQDGAFNSADTAAAGKIVSECKHAQRQGDHNREVQAQ